MGCLKREDADTLFAIIKNDEPEKVTAYLNDDHNSCVAGRFMLVLGDVLDGPAPDSLHAHDYLMFAAIGVYLDVPTPPVPLWVITTTAWTHHVASSDT